MTLSGKERYARWYAKPENKKKRIEYMREKRQYWRSLYVLKQVAYEDIPKAFRYFKK